MTSFRQIEANRRNAHKSTGPRTEAGKQASRGNAVRHGLTAETVIGALEDAADYRAFEAAITTDYDAQSSVERELVLRLASLLWRLRRAIAIETGLLQTAGSSPQETGAAGELSRLVPVLHPVPAPSFQNGSECRFLGKRIDPPDGHDANMMRPEPALNSALAYRFLRLANLDGGGFERLGRYETALWRQVHQTIFVLDVMRRQNLDRRWLSRRSAPSARFRFSHSGFMRP